MWELLRLIWTGGKIKIYITFTNTSTSIPIELVLASLTRSESAAEIYLGERCVARLNKENKFLSNTPCMSPCPTLVFSPFRLLMSPNFPSRPVPSRPPDMMTVAPGVDLAFMAAVCVSYDKILQARRSAANGAASSSAGATAAAVSVC